MLLHFSVTIISMSLVISLCRRSTESAPATLMMDLEGSSEQAQAGLDEELGHVGCVKADRDGNGTLDPEEVLQLLPKRTPHERVAPSLTRNARERACASMAAPPAGSATTAGPTFQATDYASQHAPRQVQVGEKRVI